MHEKTHPIVADEDGLVITGHTRYEAAIKLEVSLHVADAPPADAEENPA